MHCQKQFFRRRSSTAKLLKLEVWSSERSSRRWFREKQEVRLIDWLNWLIDWIDWLIELIDWLIDWLFENRHRLCNSKERTRMSICEKENLFNSYWKFESQSFYLRAYSMQRRDYDNEAISSEWTSNTCLKSKLTSKSSVEDLAHLLHESSQQNVENRSR